MKNFLILIIGTLIRIELNGLVGFQRDAIQVNLATIDWTAISAIAVSITIVFIYKQTNATRKMSDTMARSETLPKLDFVLRNSPNSNYPSVVVFNGGFTLGYFKLKTNIGLQNETDIISYIPKDSQKCRPEDLFGRSDIDTFISFTPVIINSGDDFNYFLNELNIEQKEKVIVTITIVVSPILKDEGVSPLEYKKDYYFRDGKWENRNLGTSEDHMYVANSIRLFGMESTQRGK